MLWWVWWSRGLRLGLRLRALRRFLKGGECLLAGALGGCKKCCGRMPMTVVVAAAMLSWTPRRLGLPSSAWHETPHCWQAGFEIG